MRLLALCLIASCASSVPAGPTPVESFPKAEGDPVVLSDPLPAAPDSSVVTVTGVYLSGFEASALTPCDRNGEIWWVHPDESFTEAYSALHRRHVPTLSRGARFYARARVTGTLVQGNEHGYGHLGGYQGDFHVTETHNLTFLAVDPDEPPRCS